MGLVGYAPTTPAMSMQYSTIELQSQMYTELISQYHFDYIDYKLQFFENIFVFLLIEYIRDKFSQKIVRL